MFKQKDQKTLLLKMRSLVIFIFILSTGQDESSVFMAPLIGQC